MESGSCANVRGLGEGGVGSPSPSRVGDPTPPPPVVGGMLIPPPTIDAGKFGMWVDFYPSLNFLSQTLTAVYYQVMEVDKNL